MRKVWIYIGLLTFLTYSCNKDLQQDPGYNTIVSSGMVIEDEIEQAKNVFQYLYLPAEMSDMFDNMNAGYNPSLLNNPEKAVKYIFSNEMAIALGMYGVDLGYVRLFEQWNSSVLYLETIRDLAGRLGVPQNVFEDLAKYIDKPVHNKDSLKLLANNMYLLIDSHFRQNAHDRASALLILGGWIEAMHIAVNLYEKNKSDEILLKVLEQRFTLFSVINLLEIHSKDEAVNSYMAQLFDIQNIINSLNISYLAYQNNKSDIFLKQALNTHINKATVQINLFYYNLNH